MTNATTENHINSNERVMTNATGFSSSIETLITNIEAQAEARKPVYRTMQSLLKQLRDSHNVELGCVLNRPGHVLQGECKRVVEAFKNGTVKQQEPKVEKVKTTKAKTPVTHTSDKVEPVAPASAPKEASSDLLLKEAQAEIESLRKQLADKINEVAEYAEALEHAQATIKKQQEALKLQSMSTAPTPVAEVVEQPAVEVVAEVDECDEEDTSDAVDTMMIMLADGQRDVLNATADIVQRKLGKTRAGQFIDALDSIEFLDLSSFADGFRNLMKTYNVKLEWVEQAVEATR